MIILQTALNAFNISIFAVISAGNIQYVNAAHAYIFL